MERARATHFLLMSAVTKDGVCQTSQQNIHYFSPLKQVKLLPSKLSILLPPAATQQQQQTDGSVTHLVVRNEGPGVAPFVFLQSEQVAGHFSDNGFMLLPREEKQLQFISHHDNAEPCPPLDKDQFAKQCTVISLRDSYWALSALCSLSPLSLSLYAKAMANHIYICLMFTSLCALLQKEVSSTWGGQNAIMIHK